MPPHICTFCHQHHHISYNFVLKICCCCLVTISSGKSKPKAIFLSQQHNRENNTNDYKHVSSYLLQTCANLTQLKQLHAHFLTSGFALNMFLATKLLGMYAQFGNLENARVVFDKFGRGDDGFGDVWMWNSMIREYSRGGFFEETLNLYQQMKWEGLKANDSTFPFVLKACAGISDMREGKMVHKDIIRAGFESDVRVGSALVDMYAKCGSVENARQVFDKMPQRDVVLWTAMIAGCVQNGCASEALELLDEMQEVGVMPNCVTVASVLPACGDLGALQRGKWLHDYLARRGFECNVFVGTALVDMYAKCGCVEFARQVFDKIPKRNVVSWSAMIGGYAMNGCVNEALELFNQMQVQGVRPNSVTFVNVLLACAHLGALQQGKGIHDHVMRTGLDSDVAVGTGLIDMYAKCGTIEMARQVFDRMRNRDVVSWSAMIAGYGLHGYGEKALLVFSQMLETDEKPNGITFIGVLNACSRAGRVDEGRHYFECMRKVYCITPSLRHYACMVDVLARAGHFNEAQDLIEGMPLEPDVGVWGALLGACRIHGNIELGVHVAECIFALEPEDAGYYVLLSNIYAEAGRWNDVIKIRGMMRTRGVRKPPGYSFVEVNSQVHAFLVGDKLHPQFEKTYAMLEALAE